VARHISVRQQGIFVPRNLDEPIDVLFDGNRVWSFNPARDGRQVDGWSRVGWPAVLRPHLAGTTEVRLAAHVDGRQLFTREVTFGGDHNRRVRVVDPEGNQLSVDKAGRLQRDFTHVDAGMRDQIVDAVDRVLRDLREVCGLDGFLSYGCLLGAVRDGHMIGHDSDADVSYLSRWTHPYDIARESRAAARAMRLRGWQVVRMSAANFKVWVPTPDGRRVGIDVFGGFYIGDHFYLTASLRGHLDRSAMLPLGSVVLEGRVLPAPAKPDEFLALTYGPGWRVPDPAFHFNHDPADVHRMDAWFRASRNKMRFWQTFYRSPRVEKVPTERSLFAVWVEDRIGPGDRVIDVGAGTGRDAAWFAKQGHPVTALDYARLRSKKRGGKVKAPVRVRHFNVEDLAGVLTAGARLAHDAVTEPEIRQVYARGLFDSLSAPGRDNFWRYASMAQRRGGQTFVEFRTPAGRDEHFFFGRHRREFPDPDEVVREVERHGGTVAERVIGRDLAPLGKENPEICRLVVRWIR